MFTYKELLISAFTMVIHNKHLWFFGLFAAFIANSGVFQRIYINDTSGLLQDWQRLQATGIFDVHNLQGLAQLATLDPIGFVLRAGVLALVLALGIVIFWLAIVSQGALIRAVAAITSNKKMNFRTALAGGIQTFWSVGVLRVLEKTLIVGLLFAAGLLGAYALLAATPLTMRIAAGLVFVLALAIIMAVVLVTRYAMSYRVIEDSPLVVAVGQGVTLLWRNLAVSVEAAAVIFVVNIILGFFVLMAVAAAVIPFVLLMFVFYKLAFAAGLTLILVVGTVLLFVGVAVAGAILTAFSDALWTLFFMRVSRQKLHNHLRNLFGLLRS